VHLPVVEKLLWKIELQKQEDKVKLEEGVEAFKVTALHFHPQKAPGYGTGMVLLQ
jgi:hypothetical protein